MEIAEADVIILVADGSDSLQEVKRKVDVCLDTFSQIGVNSVPIVTALNKIDLLSVAEVEARVSMLRNLGARVVPVSARDGLNVTELVEAVEGLLPGLSTYSITLPYGDSTMSMVSGIHEAGHVESQSYREDGVEIEASLTLDAAQKLFKMLPRGSLRRIESAPPDADKPGETS
jgi:GTP-binding protein HflX